MSEWTKSVLGDPDAATCPYHWTVLLTITRANCWTTILSHLRSNRTLCSIMHADQDGLGAGPVRDQQRWWEGAENTHSFSVSSVDTNWAPENGIQPDNTPQHGLSARTTAFASLV